MTLVGRAGCHLCDVAREVIEVVCAESNVEWAQVSIEDHPDLADRFADQIPVVIVDGRVHDIYRVNPDRLRSSLA